MEGGDQHTEVALALWSYQTDKFSNDWSFMTMNSAMSLDEVRQNPTTALANAVPEQGLWTLISAEMEGDQDIKIVAQRNFVSGLD